MSAPRHDEAGEPRPGSVASTVGEIVALFTAYGSHRYDEALSQNEHALQTAALARRDGASDELVVAALLHDVGHLLDLSAAGASWAPAADDLHHEASGARYLSGVFPPTVTAPVALHVRAKRYRVATDPVYAATLSAGSLASLAKQGGAMDAEEQSSFAANPGFESAVALRRWDDGGKSDGLVVAPFDDYLGLLERVAANPVGTDIPDGGMNANPDGGPDGGPDGADRTGSRPLR